MGDHIIETIGKWGVRTRPFSLRASRPGPGDPVDVLAFVGEYPYKGFRYARLASKEIDDDGRAYWTACLGGGGSVFLGESGVSISGGPWVKMFETDLVPEYRTMQVLFWNWGDNGMGAGHGVNYKIDRPVFRLARKGG